MPTTVVKSIGTAGGRDYTTIAAWEDAAPANLVTADQVWRGECYADSTFSLSSFVELAGSTSDATRFKELTAAAGQSFADNLGTNPLRIDASYGVYITCTPGYQAAIVRVNEAHSKLRRVQIYAPAATDGCVRVNGAHSRAIGCIASLTSNGGAWSQGAFEVHGNPGAAAINCVAIERGSSNTSGISCTYNTSVIGCTVVRTSGSAIGNGIAHYYSGSGQVGRNNAVFGFAKGADNPAASSSQTNFCDVTSPGTGWTGGVAFSTATFVNVTAATLDLKLPSGSALLDVGTTDATNQPDDIRALARPQGSAYDVGAWERQGAAAATSNAPRRGGPRFSNLLSM